MASLNPLTGALGKQKAAHLLRRATFGATPQQINTFATKTATQAVNDLFQAVTLPDPPTDPQTGTTWVNSESTEANSEEVVLQEVFKRWFVGRMIDEGVSAKEKVVFFLHSHFTAIQSVIERSRAMYFQNALQRMFAYDKTGTFTFKLLSKKICVDNAMLRLLDGRLNIKGRIQENFARELIELYTVGRGRNVQPTGPDDYVVFTQSDVVEAAKVLSGYDYDDTYGTIDTETNIPRGILKLNNTIAFQHDNTVKNFSSAFNNTVITPDASLFDNGQPTEESVFDELDKLITMLYEASDETAMNICRKLYRFYVYYDITDDIDSNIITPLATDFKNNGFRIQPIIEKLLQSEHFYDSANADVNDDNFAAIIKSPLDLVVGALKLFGVETSSFADFQMSMGSLISSIDNQGMLFYEPFDVSGYVAYHQEPLWNRNWISTNNLTNRYNFIAQLFAEMDGGNNAFGFTIDYIKFIEDNISDPSNPNTLVQELAEIILPQSITTERQNYFKFILNQDLPDMNWTIEWNNRANPAGGAKLQINKLLNAMMQSPEYQLF